MSELSAPDSKRSYNRFLLLVAGLGGLLYGVDVGIIGGALPYLEATSRTDCGAAFDHCGGGAAGQRYLDAVRRPAGRLDGPQAADDRSAGAFVVSIPVIALSHGYGPLFFGRLLQGISGGLIGVVVPLYLAECLRRRIAARARHFSVAADAGHRGGGADRNLFQLSGGGRGRHCDAARALHVQGPGMAAHLLGFAAAGDSVRAGQLVGGRVAALAFPARARRSRPMRRCCARARRSRPRWN